MSNLIFIFDENKKWLFADVYRNIIQTCFVVCAQVTALEKFSKLILLNLAFVLPCLDLHVTLWSRINEGVLVSGSGAWKILQKNNEIVSQQNRISFLYEFIYTRRFEGMPLCKMLKFHLFSCNFP